MLTDEVEGLKFKLTDGVDVAKDGMIYFTDASHKYSLHEFVRDVLEGRPYGRLLSYDPVSKRTQVLLTHLYFPNGVAVSPDQNYLLFCETSMYAISNNSINFFNYVPLDRACLILLILLWQEKVQKVLHPGQ